MYKRIFVAVDGSDHAINATRHAAELAKALDAKLTLIHAYPDPSDVLGSTDYSQVVAKREKAGQEILDAASSVIDNPQVLAGSLLVKDPAAEAVLEAAEQSQAELIVLGSRGMGNLKRLLLGSVSQKVAQLSHCPVLLVH